MPSELARETTFETLYSDLNPEQRQVVSAPITQHTQVLAGAGTGKTHMMTARAVKLMADLQQENSPNPAAQLFIATFTEKAAAELRHRIEQQHQALFNKSLPKTAWIGTLHALANRILSENTASSNATILVQHEGIDAEAPLRLNEANILSGLDLVLLQESLQELLLSTPVNDITAMLQLTTPAPFELEALLESGIGRLDDLLHQIIFTLIPKIKAAGLSSQAFSQLARQQSEQLTAAIINTPVQSDASGTLFTSLEEVLQTWTHAWTPWMSPGASLDISEQKTKLAEWIAIEKGKKPPTYSQLLRENLKPFLEIKRFVAYDGRKKSEPFSAITQNFEGEQQQLALEKQLIQLTSWIYDCYQARLKQEGCLDFDDIILETIALLQRDLSVAEKYHQQFRHFLIDEFQDTNGAQLALIQALSNQSAPLTVVGDLKQSIYGFRYAQPENLNNIFDTRPVVEKVTLKTNYRATPNLIRVANRCTEWMELTEDAFLYPNPAASFPNNAIPAWLHIDGSLSQLEKLQQETQWISTEIETLLQSDSYSPRDIAVLIPNHKKAIELEKALLEKDIPAIRQKALGFFDDVLFKALVSFLHWLFSPETDMALISMLQHQYHHSELQQLARLQKELNEHFAKENHTPWTYHAILQSLADKTLCVESPELLKLIECAPGYIETQQTLSPLKPHHVIAQLIKNPAIYQLFFPTDWLVGQEDNLLFFQTVLQHWAEKGQRPKSTEDVMTCLLRAQEDNVLSWPLESENSNTIKPDIDAVLLLTTHAAKGLEFPVVFYAGLEYSRKSRASGLLGFEPATGGKAGYGLFLNRFQEEKTLKSIFYQALWEKPRYEMEQLRLLYVGLTRAKQQLYISSSPQSFAYLKPDCFESLVAPVTSVTMNKSEQKESII